jgi:hypothetical protein
VYYSYDIHGNVKTLIRQITALNAAELDEEYKTVDYDYDLISGKVNSVVYQKGYMDQYIHNYAYDDHNRLTHVSSGVRTETMQQDAHYLYYAHGPLARTELGNTIQGIDYAYTIQGWLKSVNSGSLKNDVEMGRDGLVPAIGSDIHQNFAPDVAGFVLQYYQNDFNAVGTFSSFLPTTAGSDLANASKDLYNGNIKMMTTAISKFMENSAHPLGTAYSYDQLNRIIEAQYFNNCSSNAWDHGGAAMSDYRNTFAYDANGNITSQLRNGSSLQGISMDNLTYQYNWVDPTDHSKGILNNQLKGVYDAVGVSGYEDDIKNQTATNFEYDEIGNLIKDVSEEIDRIEWTVYGKISKIIRTTSSLKPDMEFEYTPDGHRAVKIIIPKNPEQLRTYLYYVRDAQGNILATYERKHDKILDYNGLTYAQVNDAITNRVGYSGFASFIAEEHGPGKNYYNSEMNNYIQANLLGMSALGIKNFLVDNSPIGILNDNNSLFNSVVANYDVSTYVTNVLGNENANNLMLTICQCMQARNTADASNPQLYQWIPLGANGLEWFFRALADYDINQFRDVLGAMGIGWTGSIDAAIDNILAISNPEDIANALRGANFDDCNKISQIFEHLQSMNNSKYLEILAAIPDVQTITSGNSGCTPIATNTIATDLYNYDALLLWTKMIALGDVTNYLEWLKNNALRDYLYTTGMQHPDYITQYQQAHNMYSSTGNGIKEYFALMRNYFGQSNYDYILSSFYHQSYTYTDSFNISEHHIYGSSRLGIHKSGVNLYYAKVVVTITSTTGATIAQPDPELNMNEFSFTRGEKNYELSNHLGNVLTVISDKKIQNCGANSPYNSYTADIITAADYSPFGAPLPDRQYDAVKELNRNILAQNNFDANTEGWSNTTGATVTQNGGKLKTNITTANAGATKYVSTLQGVDYIVKLTVDINNTPPPLLLYVKDASSPSTIATLNINASGTYRLKFRATGGNTTVYIASTVAATSIFYIDAVIIEEDKLSKAGYRFGFNGQEKDDEVDGAGNSYTAEFWQYDPRLGRRWNMDPKHFAWESPYSVMADNPICNTDIRGDKWKDPQKDGAKAAELKKDLSSREKSLSRDQEKYEKKAERFKGKDQEKYDQYSSLANKAKEGVMEMRNAQTELDVMGSEKTSQVFAFEEITGSGFAKTYMDKDGVINMRYFSGDNANAIHEASHAYGHLSGDIRFEVGGASFVDIHDEVRAYNRQFLFSPSSVLSIKLIDGTTIGSFKRINAENVRMIIEESSSGVTRQPYLNFSNNKLPMK